MLTKPHSGFPVHTAVWVPEDDRAFATRLARYCARNPVALERLTYDRAVKSVTDRSDKSEGPMAGTGTVDPLEFLARVLVHIPDTGHVTTRDDGWPPEMPPADGRRSCSNSWKSIRTHRRTRASPAVRTPSTSPRRPDNARGRSAIGRYTRRPRVRSLSRAAAPGFSGNPGVALPLDSPCDATLFLDRSTRLAPRRCCCSRHSRSPAV